MALHNLALFLGGTLFGSAGLKVLGSKDAKKVYAHVTAAGLRAAQSVMTTVTAVREGAEDILAEARQINEDRAAAEEAQILDEETDGE